MKETSLTHLIGSNTINDAGAGGDPLTLGRDAVKDALDVGCDLESQDVLIVTIPVTLFPPSSHQTTLGVIFQFSIVVRFTKKLSNFISTLSSD